MESNKLHAANLKVFFVGYLEPLVGYLEPLEGYLEALWSIWSHYDQFGAI